MTHLLESANNKTSDIGVKRAITKLIKLISELQNKSIYNLMQPFLEVLIETVAPRKHLKLRHYTAQSQIGILYRDRVLLIHSASAIYLKHAQPRPFKHIPRAYTDLQGRRVIAVQKRLLQES